MKVVENLRIKHLVIFAIILSISFFIFYNQVYYPEKYKSDISAHIDFTIQHFTNGKPIAHPGFHYTIYIISEIFNLSIKNAAVVALVINTLFVALVFFYILRRFLKEIISENWILFFTFLLMFISALYVPFFNKNIYLGQGSPSVWHNPTLIAVKPWAFLATFYYVILINRNHVRKCEYLILSIIMVLTLIMKPSFAIAFIPGIFLYILLKKSLFAEKIRKYLITLIIFVPSLMLLLNQYFTKFGEKSDSEVILDFLGVWSRSSPNVSISLILLIAFPVLFLILFPKSVYKNDYLFLSWLSFIIALIQYAIFAETGPKYSHGNFGWGRQIIVPLLYLFSLIELVKVHYQKNEPKIKVFLLGFVLCLQFLSGLIYVFQIMITGSYR